MHLLIVEDDGSYEVPPCCNVHYSVYPMNFVPATCPGRSQKLLGWTYTSISALPMEKSLSVAS